MSCISEMNNALLLGMSNSRNINIFEEHFEACLMQIDAHAPVNERGRVILENKKLHSTSGECDKAGFLTAYMLSAQHQMGEMVDFMEEK